jgi:hypothetical protein
MTLYEIKRAKIQVSGASLPWDEVDRVDTRDGTTRTSISKLRKEALQAIQGGPKTEAGKPQR